MENKETIKSEEELWSDGSFAETLGPEEIKLKQREVAQYARISEPALRENFEKLIDKVDLVKLREYADRINE